MNRACNGFISDSINDCLMKEDDFASKRFGLHTVRRIPASFIYWLPPDILFLVTVYLYKFISFLFLCLPVILHHGFSVFNPLFPRYTSTPVAFNLVYKMLLGVTCSSAMFKSLIDVIAFINETQVLMYDKSNFIINPQYIYKYIYIQSMLSKKLPPSRGLPIYI